MKSKRSQALNFYLKYIMRPFQAKVPVSDFSLKGIDKIVDMGTFILNRVPKHVSIEKTDINGISAEWVIAGDQSENNRVLLYLHGGGYFFGSPQTHRPITWRLSDNANVKVLSVDYRMVPDHTIYDALTDAVSSYKWLLQKGYQPENIAIGGDSAGGGLTLSTLLKLKEIKIPLPAAAFVISPFADITGNSKTLKENARNEHLFHVNLMNGFLSYLRTRYNMHDPYVSPCYGNYENFPPLFIQVSDTELLYGDSLLVKQAAEKAGIPVEFSMWPNMPHVFTIFSNLIPEGKEGVKEISKFLLKKLGQPQ